MIVRKISNIIDTDREVRARGWTSRRMLLKKDGMGFSMHETIIHAGAELHLHYKNHLEAVYCTEGEGSIEEVKNGKIHTIEPGTIYALNENDKHILRAQTEMTMVCVFNPPVTGQEVHDEDGAYAIVDEE